jgi:hypothetical protein
MLYFIRLAKGEEKVRDKEGKLPQLPLQTKTAEYRHYFYERVFHVTAARERAR